MAGFFNFKDFFNPGDDLVGGWVRRLVKVDHTVVLEHVNRAVRGRVATRKGREVRCFHVKPVEVLQGKYMNKATRKEKVYSESRLREFSWDIQL